MDLPESLGCLHLQPVHLDALHARATATCVSAAGPVLAVGYVFAAPCTRPLRPFAALTAAAAFPSLPFVSSTDSGRVYVYRGGPTGLRLSEIAPVGDHVEATLVTRVALTASSDVVAVGFETGEVLCYVLSGVFVGVCLSVSLFLRLSVSPHLSMSPPRLRLCLRALSVSLCVAPPSRPLCCARRCPPRQGVRAVESHTARGVHHLLVVGRHAVVHRRRTRPRHHVHREHPSTRSVPLAPWCAPQHLFLSPYHPPHPSPPPFRVGTAVLSLVRTLLHIDFHTVIKETTPIVQLSLGSGDDGTPAVAVSCHSRVAVVPVPRSGKPGAPIQLGQSLRDGRFGACFSPLVRAQLFAARKGKRMWLGDAASGAVAATLKYASEPMRDFASGQDLCLAGKPPKRTQFGSVAAFRVKVPLCSPSHRDARTTHLLVCTW